ncbi:branched-chain amino acid ABC transporter substrate-binding protein [Pseudomonas fluorescens HK44]|uniref:Branched-chain amino acid ABC transporter substrate-binding protein n=1 Tax=Pseudomonas fluorescens HK44 TaxID=1042209 RepID=A0A010TFI1_PSEFL|nr:ABC transporter substrate-binding protein [Pseudomonas fluorescens]EXF95902.1 branched-chain amino acid ABC transporter substrate-binding protein [Pseudomonas fluorescens HK44]
MKSQHPSLAISALRIAVTCAALTTGHAFAATSTLYVAGAGGSIEQAYKTKVIPGFEKLHDVKVVYVAGNSTEVLAKLQAQKGRQQINVAIMDDGPMYQALQQGLCAKLEESAVYKDLYPIARLSAEATGIGVVATGIGYNEEAFKKRGWPAPNSWEDLKDPRFKQLIGLPPVTNTYGLHTLVEMARLHGGSEKNIEPGFNALKDEVAPNVLAWVAAPGEMDGMMQNGDIVMAVYGSGRALALQDTGFPLKFVYPKEGGIALQLAACGITPNAQPELSQQFIQYVLSPEAQGVLAKEIGFAPVNQTVQLSPEVAARMPYGPDKVSALIKVDWDTINQQRSEWTARWNRTVER